MGVTFPSMVFHVPGDVLPWYHPLVPSWCASSHGLEVTEEMYSHGMTPLYHGWSIFSHGPYTYPAHVTLVLHLLGHCTPQEHKHRHDHFTEHTPTQYRSARSKQAADDQSKTRSPESMGIQHKHPLASEVNPNVTPHIVHIPSSFTLLIPFLVRVGELALG